MIILQSKKDPKRPPIEVTNEQYQQMVENGFHKAWKVVNPDAMKEYDKTILAKVDETMGSYIARKKTLNTIPAIEQVTEEKPKRKRK